MTDIVERLKDAENATHALFNHIFQDAREEIELLRAKIERMEKQVPICRAEDLKHAESLLPMLGLKPENHLYTLPGAQPAPSVPNLDMDAIERQNDALKEEVGKLRDALVLIADQYEPKCDLLIPSIARSALCATGSYGQTKAQPAPSVPIDSIGKLLTQAMDVAVANGANSVSMPDEYVEVAAWLSGVQPAPKPEGA